MVWYVRCLCLTEIFEGFVMIRFVSFMSKLLPEGCKKNDGVETFLFDLVAHYVESI